MVFVWVVEIDLVFVSGPKMTWFYVGIEIDSFFVWVVEIELISVTGSKLTWFLFGGRT